MNPPKDEPNIVFMRKL